MRALYLAQGYMWSSPHTARALYIWVLTSGACEHCTHLAQGYICGPHHTTRSMRIVYVYIWVLASGACDGGAKHRAAQALYACAVDY